MEQDLILRLEKLEAARELENLVGTYCHLLFAGKGPQIMERLWSGAQDIAIEIGASGPYRSRKKVSSYYEKDHIPGKFQLLLPTTPIIRIADDGNSATGVWLMTELDTDAGDLGAERPADPERRKLFTSRTEEGQAYQAEISLWKLAISFRREEGAWKIWRLHQFDMLRFPCGKDWVQFAKERFATDGMRLDAWFTSNLPYGEDEPPENLASGPTEYHWQYQVDTLTDFVPEV